MRPDHETLITQYTLLPIPQPKKLTSLRLRLNLYTRKYRTRRQLGRLSQRQLQDIGLTREQADAEAKKPFWR